MASKAFITEITTTILTNRVENIIMRRCILIALKILALESKVMWLMETDQYALKWIDLDCGWVWLNCIWLGYTIIHCGLHKSFMHLIALNSWFEYRKNGRGQRMGSKFCWHGNVFFLISFLLIFFFQMLSTEKGKRNQRLQQRGESIKNRRNN